MTLYVDDVLRCVWSGRGIDGCHPCVWSSRDTVDRGRLSPHDIAVAMGRDAAYEQWLLDAWYKADAAHPALKGWKSYACIQCGRLCFVHPKGPRHPPVSYYTRIKQQEAAQLALRPVQYQSALSGAAIRRFKRECWTTDHDALAALWNIAAHRKVSIRKLIRQCRRVDGDPRWARLLDIVTTSE